MVTAQWFHHRKPRVAMGRRWPGRPAILCSDREGERKDHHRPAARRSDALEGDGRDSPRTLHPGRIGGVEYPVAAPGDPRNTLTVRDSRDGQRTVIPRTSGSSLIPWRASSSPRPVHPPERRLPAREDLRIRLCGRRPGRGRRRLRCHTRLCFLCQARSRCHHSG